MKTTRRLLELGQLESMIDAKDWTRINKIIREQQKLQQYEQRQTPASTPGTFSYCSLPAAAETYRHSVD